MLEPSQPAGDRNPVATPSAWVRPDFEVISLDCEITAYAPDGGDPLF